VVVAQVMAKVSAISIHQLSLVKHQLSFLHWFLWWKTKCFHWGLWHLLNLQ